jgi:cyclopropane-fatty-acyl-phospholipid synthase
MMDRCLTPGGRGLIQTVGFHKPQRFDRWIERRIFPGAEPPSLGEMMALFEPGDFRVLDVENLAPHYAETLRHWLERFERKAAAVEAMFDPRFVRMWRLYLAGSRAGYEVGAVQLYQVVFARRGRVVPRCRRAWYQALPG